MNGAGVTAVLLELARLKRWNLAGLSLDYFKCFDIIPQAVVLRVARELGMHGGTLWALAAMYRQLRCAFRLAGSLGEWWRATNGILQGCPLSPVLINLLTSFWKMAIDACASMWWSPPAGCRCATSGRRCRDAVGAGTPVHGSGGPVPHGACGRHAGHHPGPGGGADGGGPRGNGPHGGMDGQHQTVWQRCQVHLVAPPGAARPDGAAHAGQGGHSALVRV